MFLPNGYKIVCSKKVIVPVELKLAYGNSRKYDLRVNITPTEKKKETELEVVGCKVENGNDDEDGLMLVLGADGSKPRPILATIKDSKKNLERLLIMGEHITSYASKLTNESSNANTLVISTPYRGCGTKDYNKTTVNVTLFKDLEIKDHIGCDFSHTENYLAYIEEQLRGVLTQNRFNKFW